MWGGRHKWVKASAEAYERQQRYEDAVGRHHVWSWLGSWQMLRCRWLELACVHAHWQELREGDRTPGSQGE